MSQAVSLYRPLPRRRLTRWIAILLGLLYLWFLASCSRGPSPQDQADLVTLGATLGAACSSAAISAEDCIGARDALVRLGVSLENVQRARLLAEAWDVAKPVVTAGISILLGAVTGGGA